MSIRTKQIALALALSAVVGLGGQTAAFAHGNPAPVTRNYRPHIDPADFGRRSTTATSRSSRGPRRSPRASPRTARRRSATSQVVTHRKRSPRRGASSSATRSRRAATRSSGPSTGTHRTSTATSGTSARTPATTATGTVSRATAPGRPASTAPSPGSSCPATRSAASLPPGVLPGPRRGPGAGARRHRPGESAGRHYRHTIGTRENSRLEPGIVEKKWYAPGLGEIKSQDVKGSKEGFRLVKVTH